MAGRPRVDMPVTAEVRSLVQKAKRANAAIAAAESKMRRQAERRHELIRELMDGHGLPARQVAELTGTTEATIYTARSRAARTPADPIP